ncbi:MAG: PASTA domain-containing protein [bacterium]|nr:MAG: PASTA domain-containing protein [bacterium]
MNRINLRYAVLLMVCLLNFQKAQAQKPEKLKVPNFVGRSVEVARVTIQELGVNMVAEPRPNSDYEPGTVFEQTPSVGTPLSDVTTVYLLIAVVEEKVQVPDLVGRTLEVASAILLEANIPVVVTEVKTTEYKPGTVLRQSQTAGSEIPVGAYLNLAVAISADHINVPNVMGRHIKEATAMLREARLQLVTFPESTSEYEVGEVFEQRPSSGTQVALGTPVYLKVATRTDGGIVPNFVGESVEVASSILDTLGLNMAAVPYRVSEYKSKTVFEQIPSAGTPLSEVATVYLSVAMPIEIDIVGTVPEEIVQVPDLVGKSIESAREILQTARLEIGQVDLKSTAEYEPGIVILQSQNAGSEISVGTPIDIVVATSGVMINVPNVAGRTTEEAKEMLFNAQLGVDSIQYVNSTEYAPDIVLNQTPVAGTQLKAGSTVHLEVAKVVTAVIPYLERLPLEEAQRLLKDVGLLAGVTVVEEISKLKPGTVLRHSPTFGTSVPIGSTIKLVVATREKFSSILILITASILLMIVLGYGLLKLKKRIYYPKSKIQFEPRIDVGFQQIKQNDPIKSGFELSFKPVMDYGKQDIKIDRGLILKESTTAKAEPAKAKEETTPLIFDDLTRIEGIGPIIFSLLQSSGITTFSQLAATSVNQLRKLLKKARITVADPATWPEQARLAAGGKWDAFDALKEELKGGRVV